MKVQTVPNCEVYLSGIEFFSLAMALKGYRVEVTAFEAFTNRHVSPLFMNVWKIARDRNGHFEIQGTLTFADGQEKEFHGVYDGGTKHFPCMLADIISRG